MTRRQLDYALFPTGEMLKPEVRTTASRFALPVADKKDSQGICFLGQVKMTDFLRHYLPDTPGDIVDTTGKILGQHSGLHLYTLGQRKGHGVASPREGMAYVVVGKDASQNHLILGWDTPDSGSLYSQSCIVGSLSIIDADFHHKQLIEAQPRYRAKAEPARIETLGDGTLKLHFLTPQRAIVPGQICAFYDGGRLLGGGVFQQTSPSTH